MTGLHAGDIVHLTRAASVQFNNPIFFRLIRVHDWTTYDGWIWLDGYELGTNGEAVARRSVFVQKSGLRVRRTTPVRQPGRSNVRGQPIRRHSPHVEDHGPAP